MLVHISVMVENKCSITPLPMQNTNYRQSALDTAQV
jgi:hypothetical protein